MTFDVGRARADTPGVEHVLHFNSAGSSLPPRQVVDAVVDHIRLEAEIGGYEAYDRQREAIERPYDALAALLNCSRDEVAIVENATTAWGLAFYALPLRAGDKILTGRAEYSSNYIAFLQVAQRTGVAIEVVPDDEHGQIDVGKLEAAIDDRTRLIALTHVPTSGGLVNPAEAVGAVARRAGVLYLLDACQSVGQMPIDVEAIGCDMLSGTGRKYLRGPRGTGFLYVRRDVLPLLEPPFLNDHAATWIDDDRYVIRDDARKFETWEGSIAAKIGLGVAVDYALGWGLPAIQARVRALADHLRERLESIPGVRVHDLGRDRCGIVTFSPRVLPAKDVRALLRAQNINVTVSVAESTRLDLVPRGLDQIVRASIHYFNTNDEVDAFTTALRAIEREAA